MAVELTKSTAVTNASAAPRVNNPMSIDGGRIKHRVGRTEFSATASIASIARLLRVKSSDLVAQLLLSCDAITSAAGDIGLYDIESVNSGAVVDVDFFASAQSLASALKNSDVGHEADSADAGAGFGLADTEKKVWELLGLTADPGKEYDVAITLTAAATAAGTAVLRMYYVDGN